MTNESPPIIRCAQSHDLSRILTLLRQLNEFTHSEAQIEYAHLESLFAEMDAAPALYLNLVCEGQGQVVGFLSMIFYRTPFHTGGTALINELVIDRDFRRGGIGQLLITRAIAEARERGMDEIEVGTEKSNQAAQDFYHKAGFDEEFVLLSMEFGEKVQE